MGHSMVKIRIKVKKKKNTKKEVEDCFTPWLIHDEGELYLESSRNLFFRSQAFELLKQFIFRR